MLSNLLSARTTVLVVEAFVQSRVEVVLQVVFNKCSDMSICHRPFCSLNNCKQNIFFPRNGSQAWGVFFFLFF